MSVAFFDIFSPPFASGNATASKNGLLPLDYFGRLANPTGGVNFAWLSTTHQVLRRLQLLLEGQIDLTAESRE